MNLTTTDIAEPVTTPVARPGFGVRSLGRLKAWRIGLSFFAIYLALSLIYQHTFLPHMATRTVGGGSGDAALFLSWLKWDQFSLWHGMYPLLNPYLQAPYGVSAVWNTSVLALGIVMSPITALFGPTATFNVLYLLAPALNCWTASKWLRRYVRPIPAFVGGLMFGFSPFVILHLRGHLHLFFLVLVPVIVMLVEDLVWRKERPLWPTAPLLGLVCFLQYLISSEVLLILALALVPTVVLVALLYWPQAKARLKKVVVAGLVTAGVAVVLLALPLIEQFSPSVKLTQSIFDAHEFEASFSQLVSPSALFWLHQQGGGAGNLHGGENAVYIGWPLAVVLPAITVLLRRNKLVIVAFVVAVFAVFCELNIRYSPFNLARHVLTVAENIVAARFALVFALAAGFLVAHGLQWAIDQLRTARAAGRQRGRWVGGIAMVLILASLVPWISNRPPIVFGVSPSPAFFTNGELQRTVPQNSIVMLAPMANSSQNRGMQMQIDSNFWFRQLGGYSLNNSGTGKPSFYPRQTTLIAIFAIIASKLRANIKANMWVTARHELADSKATFLIVAPDPPGNRWLKEEVKRATRLVGRPPDQQFDTVYVWDLRTKCGTDANTGALCPAS